MAGVPESDAEQRELVGRLVERAQPEAWSWWARAGCCPAW